MSKKKILVVDDDRKFLKKIVHHLGEAGFQTRTATNAEAAIEAALTFGPDLIILDIVLPEEFLPTGERADGLTVLKRLRKKSNVPVLMLSATGLSSLKVLALDLGADDYLTKPFDVRELLARVNAILRRGKRADAEPEECIFHGLRIETDTHRVWKEERQIELTPIEFALLRTMAYRPGLVLSRERLLQAAWSETHVGDVRVVDTHISSLRKKIEPDPLNPSFIVTVRGSGYRFEGRRVNG